MDRLLGLILILFFLFGGGILELIGKAMREKKKGTEKESLDERLEEALRQSRRRGEPRPERSPPPVGPVRTQAGEPRARGAATPPMPGAPARPRRPERPPPSPRSKADRPPARAAQTPPRGTETATGRRELSPTPPMRDAREGMHDLKPIESRSESTETPEGAEAKARPTRRRLREMVIAAEVVSAPLARRPFTSRGGRGVDPL